MSKILNILSLLNENPFTLISDTFNSLILEKIKETLSEEDQRIFITILYCNLNYDQYKDYIISMEDISKWLGYNRKDACKACLTRHFKENKDYIIQEFNTGGRPEKKIYLTIYCFKKLSLLSRTDKVDKIYDFFLKMTDLIGLLSLDQAKDLKIKLDQTNKELQFNLLENEENLIHNSLNKKLVYLGIVEINNNYIIVKFGRTLQLDKRILYGHKKDFGEQFILKYTIFTELYEELENKIKKECKISDSILYNRRISKIYNDKNQTELLIIDKEDINKNSLTLKKLYHYILHLKTKCEFSEIDRLKQIIKNLQSNDDEEKNEE